MALVNTETGEIFKIEDLPSIWGLTIQQNWVVEDLIPSESVIMLTGESGCGKSSVTLAMADAISKGEPFLERPTKRRKVLVVDRENGLPVYHERLKRFNIQESEDLIFWGHWNSPEPQGPDSEAIIEFAKQYKPLIIFDSFVAFHTGSEQDADETRKYMDGFRRLAGIGATVIVIHHTGKGENTKEYRGSSDIKASLDVGYTLVAKKSLLQLLILKPFKSREGVLESLYITLEGDKLVLAADRNWGPIEEAIRQNPAANQGRIIELLPDIPEYTIRRILDSGVRSGKLRVEKGFKNASLYFLSERQNAQ